MLNLDTASKQVYEIAEGNGFWDDDVTIHTVLSKLALIHSEVSETLEAVRKQKGGREITLELVDTMIRILDLYQGLLRAGWVEESLDELFAEKVIYNSTRPRKHGNLA